MNDKTDIETIKAIVKEKYETTDPFFNIIALHNLEIKYYWQNNEYLSSVLVGSNLSDMPFKAVSIEMMAF